MITIICVEDFPRAFQQEWKAFDASFMGTGWITWVADHQRGNIERGSGVVFPEENKWAINFPASHFRICDTLEVFDMDKFQKL